MTQLIDIFCSLSKSRCLLGFRPSWDMAPFGALILIALGLRLWGLGERALHYDESLHAYYSWQMFAGEGYRHEPWSHGPLQFHINALIFAVFGDSDYTVRLSYALVGSVLVVIPYFLRDYIGRLGAMTASLLLAVSPSLLYFSRYSRNDIYMALWALALFVLMWRYINERKNRYLYFAAAVLAFAFATKETAYIVVAIFGIGLFLLSLTEIIPWLLGRIRLSDLTGPAVFLIVLVTLTLPQWAALSAIFQGSGSDGLVLAYSGSAPDNPTGLPLWAEPFVNLGVVNFPIYLDGFIIGGIATVGCVLTWRFGRGAKVIVGSLAWTSLVIVAYTIMAFAHLDIALNYLIAAAILAPLFALSVVVGLMWRWQVWLITAGIFYLTWFTLYTSVFSILGRSYTECPNTLTGVAEIACTKLGGVFTGQWQSLGYWLAQQDVARGNQPWYYYFVLGTVYEYLPLLLGTVAIFYYLRKGGFVGLFLVFWAVASFVAYTLASERMPWLIVNITVPFIILVGKLIGDLSDRLVWRQLISSLDILLLVSVPLFCVAGIYLLKQFVGDGLVNVWPIWLALSVVIPSGLISVALIFRTISTVRIGLTVLGVGILLLGSSVFVAGRTSYSYDDSPVEMMVYAGASPDVRESAREVKQYLSNGNLLGTALVDYEIWYPFNWYIRRDNFVEFRCYKGKNEGGYVDWCSPLKETPSAPALLLLTSHGDRDSSYLDEYIKRGPYRDLIWFPESYRRKGEDRRNETVWQEIQRDFGYVRTNITTKAAWNGALNYLIHRRLGSDWWSTKFNAYYLPEPTVTAEK